MRTERPTVSQHTNLATLTRANHTYFEPNPNFFQHFV